MRTVIQIHLDAYGFLPLSEERPATQRESWCEGASRTEKSEELVRKGGLEPPRFYPPDPKFLTNDESTTYTGRDLVLQIVTSYYIPEVYKDSRSNGSLPVGFGGGHKIGHSRGGHRDRAVPRRALLRSPALSPVSASSSPVIVPLSSPPFLSRVRVVTVAISGARRGHRVLTFAT